MMIKIDILIGCPLVYIYIYIRQKGPIYYPLMRSAIPNQWTGTQRGIHTASSRRSIWTRSTNSWKQVTQDFLLTVPIYTDTSGYS